ncbi:MAG: DUF4845 domain-containing protein, partial [Zoogloeaceae bacterium]|nr:DUF4845 domain-containing protein [Zoogloeaceae bacterium]
MRGKHDFSLGVFFPWAIIAALIIWIGIQVAPAYVEYRAVMYAVRAITLDSQTNPDAAEFSSIAAIRMHFAKQADASYITSLKAENLTITKEGGRVIIEFAYEKRIHLAGNVYL